MAAGIPSKPLHIKVKPAEVILGPPDAYSNESDPRGLVFVANWNEFAKDRSGKPIRKKRSGSLKDVTNIVNLFTQIGYRHRPCQDKNKEEFFSELEEVREEAVSSDFDSFLCVCMSHGRRDEITMRNGQVVDIEEIIGEFGIRTCLKLKKKFGKKKCVEFEKKAKLFIFVHCRNRNNRGTGTLYNRGTGTNDQAVGENQFDYRPPPMTTNAFILSSTLPGFTSKRYPSSGCSFIKVLCSIFMNHAKDKDIIRLHMMINDELKVAKCEERCELRLRVIENFFYLNPVRPRSEASASLSVEEMQKQETKLSSPHGETFDIGQHMQAAEGLGNISFKETGSSSYQSASDLDYRSCLAGAVFIVNNLKGCENDVEKIKSLFAKLSYRVILANEAASFEELKQDVENISKDGPTDLVVFFFGFGFDDFMYINREDKVSVSSREFCNLFTTQTEEKSVVIFTNTCFKRKAAETVLIPESEVVTENIFHFNVKVNGHCEKGSLLTEALIREFEPNKTQEFSRLAMGMASTIRMLQGKHEHMDVYITEIRYYGVSRTFYFTGRTQLHEAVHEGRTQLHDAAYKGSALHEAAYIGDVEAAKKLLVRGDFLIDHRNEFGKTALHSAAYRGNVFILRMFLDMGADVNAIDEKGNSSLHVAVDCSNHKMVNTLICMGAVLDLRNNDKCTPLHLATVKGDIAMIKKLIEYGPDLHNQNLTGNTGAHNAAFHGRCDILKVLLQAGFHVDFKNLKNNSLLHLAARQGHAKAVELLITKGACLDDCNNSGYSPVHLAAAVGNADIVIMLLKSKANPYNPKTGYSVLHAAASRNRLHIIQDVVTLLLDDISINAAWGNLLAEDVASTVGGRDSLWWLRKQSQRQIRPDSRLVSNLKYCRDRYEESGSTIMHRAGMSGWREPSWLKKSVVDGEIELHYMDEHGNTILHAAVKGGNEATVKNLLEVGALSIARNHQNLTPIDFAAGTILQEYLPVRASTRLDSRIASSLYSAVLSIIAQTPGLDVNDRRSGGTSEESGNNLDKQIQRRKLEVNKIVSKLLTRGVPHERLGDCDRLILPLAITTNNRTLLPMLLAAGFPLTTVDSELSIVQLAWLTPDITTWVGMVVTRAVVNQLKCELKMLQDNITTAVPSLLSCMQILIQSVNNLITEGLNGEKPWEAQFNSPDDISVTQLYITACSYGATLTSWYIWRAGGSNFDSGLPDDSSALEASLSGGHFATAFRLVVDTGANPFLMRKGSEELMIDSFPEKDRQYLLEVMLGEVYRSLDKLVEEFKDEDDKRDHQQVILLLIVLFLQYTFNVQSTESPDRWKSFLSLVIEAYYRIDWKVTLYSTSGWMVSLCEILVNEGVQGNMFHEAKSIDSDLKNIYQDSGVFEAKEIFTVDDTEDHFNLLFHTLQVNFVDTKVPRVRELIPDVKLNMLCQKALKVCCEKPLDLFLHLLISLAKPSHEIILNMVCRSRPLHHAAKNGNSSAVLYLLQCGASPFEKDRSGILPVQYASMFGHKETSTILVNSIAEDSRSEHMKLEEIYSKHHDSYLKCYGLSLDCTGKHRYCNVQSKENLLERRFSDIKSEWEQNGVQGSATRSLVCFGEGEAREIKAAVAELLSDLKKEISLRSEIFEGDIEFIGSSEDNVRLYCPDEYNCNLLLKNISAYPGKEIKAELIELEKEKIISLGHSKSMVVQPLKDYLKQLMKGSEFIDTFYKIAKDSLMSMDLNRGNLKVMVPGIKRTQVGINLTFLWLGTEYQMLFVDIDFVPTVKAPWPEGLPKPKCSLHSCHLVEVYLNNVGEDDWRLSFGPTETKIMKSLSSNKRDVFLTCKRILAAFKTESWVPLKLKYDFMFWDSQIFSLHSKGGFALKNCFFKELEEIASDEDWTGEKLLKRVCSVFERMCKLENKENAPVVGPKPVEAYFGGETRKPSIYLCAPEIVNFIREMSDKIKI